MDMTNQTNRDNHLQFNISNIKRNFNQEEKKWEGYFTIVEAEPKYLIEQFADYAKEEAKKHKPISEITLIHNGNRIILRNFTIKKYKEKLEIGQIAGYLIQFTCDEIQ